MSMDSRVDFWGCHLLSGGPGQVPRRLRQTVAWIRVRFNWILLGDGSPTFAIGI